MIISLATLACCMLTTLLRSNKLSTCWTQTASQCLLHWHKASSITPFQCCMSLCSSQVSNNKPGSIDVGLTTALLRCRRKTCDVLMATTRWLLSSQPLPCRTLSVSLVWQKRTLTETSSNGVLTVPARPDIVRNPGRGNRYALNTPGSSKSTGPFSGPPLFQEQKQQVLQAAKQKTSITGDRYYNDVISLSASLFLLSCTNSRF